MAMHNRRNVRVRNIFSAAFFLILAGAQQCNATGSGGVIPSYLTVGLGALRLNAKPMPTACVEFPPNCCRPECMIEDGCIQFFDQGGTCQRSEATGKYEMANVGSRSVQCGGINCCNPNDMTTYECEDFFQQGGRCKKSSITGKYEIPYQGSTNSTFEEDDSKEKDDMFDEPFVVKNISDVPVQMYGKKSRRLLQTSDAKPSKLRKMMSVGFMTYLVVFTAFMPILAAD